MIFTCFHPEVCVALHLKQAAFPVLLLTEGSPPPANYDDVRCKSLPAALASAINEGLQVRVYCCARRSGGTNSTTLTPFLLHQLFC